MLLLEPTYFAPTLPIKWEPVNSSRFKHRPNDCIVVSCWLNACIPSKTHSRWLLIVIQTTLGMICQSSDGQNSKVWIDTTSDVEGAKLLLMLVCTNAQREFNQQCHNKACIIQYPQTPTSYISDIHPMNKVLGDFGPQSIIPEIRAVIIPRVKSQMKTGWRA